MTISVPGETFRGILRVEACDQSVQVVWIDTDVRTMEVAFLCERDRSLALGMGGLPVNAHGRFAISGDRLWFVAERVSQFAT